MWGKVKAIASSVWRFICRVCHWLACFFNLLEPDSDTPVLSISKFSMWSTLGCTIYVTLHNPTGSEIATALGAQLAATGNYVYRRMLQAQTQTAGYRPKSSEVPTDGQDQA